MKIVKYEDIKKMDKKARDEKLKELKLELSRAGLAANKTKAKTKEIKKAIARILTFTNSNMEVRKH